MFKYECITVEIFKIIYVPGGSKEGVKRRMCECV